ncbi:relaxase domain-containing protein [Actinoplanes sp. LDG1-06]|uniref:Relaxase domain-containing protein n=1 Tax=Paractinoplanes ovalisporus TaxID=2810368 RepID=A0ABS2AW62_9ACTN|nr:MobF family relaxase [Actinoplanes ovalisporus]MBM2623404.1 relaxase domain-containing protein [Actinoplanes ovalisporus]
MLTVTRISPGAGIAYLTRQIAAGKHDFRTAEHGGLVAYHADPRARGEAPGWWAGQAERMFGMTGQVTESQMLYLIGSGQHPETGKQLGRLWRRFPALDDDARRAAVDKAWAKLAPDATYEQIAQVWLRIWTAPERHPVAGFDVTVSPVKSVSLLWAFGDGTVKQHVMAAHHDGVRATLEQLRIHGAFTRLGTNGLVQVDTDGLAAMVFDHRMSREKDPQVHSHIIVSAKVRVQRDGREDWLALDSKAFYQASVTARIAYERAVEHALHHRLGIRFAARPDSSIREIVGISARAITHYSKRRTAIESEMTDRLTEPAAGRQWVPISRWRRSAQDATLRTRARKDEPESTAQAVARWRREDRSAGFDTAGEVERIAGGQVADHVDRTARRVIHRAQHAAGDRKLQREHLYAAALRTEPASHEQLRLIVNAAVRRVPHLAVEQAIEDVTAERAVFKLEHLELAIGRALHVQTTGDRREDWRRVELLASEAVRTHAGQLRLITPPELAVWGPTLVRSSDSQSIYSRHRDLKLTTVPVLAAEKELIAFAARRDAHQAPAALLEQVASDLDLSAEKRAALVFAVGDDRRVTGIVGPAGTGKTFLQSAVAVAAQRAGIPLLGLTVGQNAAYVLADASREGGRPGIRTENIAMWLHAQHTPPNGTTNDDWTFRPGQWLIVDEASQASTLDLIELTRLLEPVEGKLILVGDPAQISAIGPGGMFRYLASLGHTTTLREVRRFEESWEGPASLRLRDGDTTALAEYDRRGRVISGERTQLVEQVLDGWAADTLHDRQSLILVETEQEAADIAIRARQMLINAGQVNPADSVKLANRTRAGIGDLVVTRRNERSLIAGDKFVANRAQWRILEISGAGNLLVEDVSGGYRTTLPASYAAQHVQLAYVATVDSAQGRTVDTARAIVDAATSHARLYVMATRGRLLNQLAVVTIDQSPESHPPAPPTAGITVLADILRADTTDRSATETEELLWADVDSLARLGPIYDDLNARAAMPRYTAVVRATCGSTAAAGLADDPALPALVGRLQALAIAGYDPLQVLAEAGAQRELATARDVASVLAWRIDETYGLVVPDPAAAAASSQTGSYTDRALTFDGDIGAALRQIAEHADRRIEALAEDAATRFPTWSNALGAVPEDPAGRRQWISRAAVVIAYRDRFEHNNDDPIGPEPSHRDPGRWAAWRRAQTVLGVATLAGRITADSENGLRQLITAQRDEERRGPQYVAGQLRVAHVELVVAEQNLRGTRLDLAIAQANARAADVRADQVRRRWWRVGPPRIRAASEQQQARATALRAASAVGELRARLDHAADRLGHAREAVRNLEVQHRAWTAWYDDALPTRYAGLAAAAELARRAQRSADTASDLAETVQLAVARVRAVDVTRPQPHRHPLPEALATSAEAAQHRVLEEFGSPSGRSEPEADHV